MTHGATWAVIIPVKPASIGKSRLASGRTDGPELARAIALDTIAAAAACSRVQRVIVVSEDGMLPLLVAGMPGLHFVPEGDARGLNEAIAEGAKTAEGMPRAALLGDLPALRATDLADALAAAGEHDRSVVSDAEGTGSTLITARAGVDWASAFGEDSFARHLGLGFVPLGIAAGSTLCRDVDTIDQLDAAAEMGLGPRTAAVLERG